MSAHNGNGTNGAGELLPAKRGYHAPRLSEMADLTPPPTGVGAWAEKLREAAYDAVKEGDVKELIQGMMEKAKGGDLKAAKFVMDFLTGGAPKVQVQTVIVHKRSKSTNRQRRDGRDEPPEGPPARPAPAALPDGPTVRVLRRLAARFLAAAGASHPAALVAELELPADELDTVMAGCDWFVLDGGRWALTPAGRQVAK